MEEERVHRIYTTRPNDEGIPFPFAIHSLEELEMYECIIKAADPLSTAMLFGFGKVVCLVPFVIDNAGEEAACFAKGQGKVAEFFGNVERMLVGFNTSRYMFVAMARKYMPPPIPRFLFSGLRCATTTIIDCHAVTEWYYDRVYTEPTCSEQVKRLLFAYACKARSRDRSSAAYENANVIDCSLTASNQVLMPGKFTQWPHWKAALDAFDAVVEFKRVLCAGYSWGYMKTNNKSSKTITLADYVFSPRMDSYRQNILDWIRATKPNAVELIAFFEHSPAASTKLNARPTFATHFLKRLFNRELAEPSHNDTFLCFVKETKAKAVEPSIFVCNPSELKFAKKRHRKELEESQRKSKEYDDEQALKRIRSEQLPPGIEHESFLNDFE